MTDNSTNISRRHALRLLGAAGTALLVGCAGQDTETGLSFPGTSTTDTSGTGSGTSTATPVETAGPFPADGTNQNGAGATANVLADSRSVRRDIRGDLDGSNVQPGTPLTLTVKVMDSSGAPATGAAVYVWHCNAEGAYSAYNSNMLGGDYSERSFLRGVQIADASGVAIFDTILPGRYQGRAFHVHFEVYSDAKYGTLLLTSQMAADDATIDALYADTGNSRALSADTDNANDNIFADGVSRQLITFGGDASALTGTFTAVV